MDWSLFRLTFGLIIFFLGRMSNCFESMRSILLLELEPWPDSGITVSGLIVLETEFLESWLRVDSTELTSIMSFSWISSVGFFLLGEPHYSLIILEIGLLIEVFNESSLSTREFWEDCL